MKLYVIRYGGSENDPKKLYTGWAQISLTEKGFADAKGVRPLWESVRFDKIYTSDLLHAKQTEETAIPNCTYEETPLLREINVGSLAGQPYGTAAVQNSDFTPCGGESREMLYDRVQQFMQQLERSEFENATAFAHAGFLRALLCTVLQSPITSATLCFANCTTTIFDYTDGKWRLHSWINP